MAKRKGGDAVTLATAKLAESGLSSEAFETLKMEALPAAATARLARGFAAVPSLLIPYFGVDGKRTSFFRARYLASPPPSFKGEPPKYAQPSGSGVAAYLPPTVAWAQVARDPRVDLFVTEGELKAAAAAYAGLPTIGLGGVFNFQSAKDGVAFLPELEAIDWRRRTTFVIFDSDFSTNAQVMVALNRLVARLTARGALARIVTLPALPGQRKTGLDDFLVARGADELHELIDDAREDRLGAELWRLNEELIYIMDPGLVVQTATGQRMAPGAFVAHHYANRTFDQVVVNASGARRVRRVNLAAEWLTWPHRTQRARLTYRPGEPPVLDEAFNTWRPGPEPRRGDMRPWHRLLDHLFSDAEPEARVWFERWCAFPFRYPGSKLFTSAVLWGVEHGTGKSLVGYTLGRAYGLHNFAELAEADLTSSFTEWAADKQFALGDDVTGNDRRHHADHLKKMITQDSMRINIKHLPSFVVPDCLNYLFTSNQPDAFFLDDRDRRFFVHEVTVGALDEEFYVAYDLWMRSNEGPPALAWYLTHEVELGDFNASAHALVTQAKRRMTDHARSDVGAWVQRLLEDPDATLRVGEASLEGDLFTNRELLVLYDPGERSRVTANGLGRELTRAGFVQVLGGRPVRAPGRALDRYYAVRNGATWARADHAAVVTHLAAGARRGRRR
jgi:hypothetical protein